MLTGMIPLIVVSDKQSNANRAIVTFKSWKGAMKSKTQTKQYSGLIGNVHQKGKQQISNKKNTNKSKKKEIDTQPAQEMKRNC